MRFDPGQSFNFLPVPTDIHFGFGIIKTLPERLKVLGAKRPLLVTDPGVAAAGILERVEAALAAAGIAAAVFDEVKPDSGSDLIAEATERLRDEQADSVVGIGGGSSLDTAKAVAAMGTNSGSILDYAGLHKIVNRPLPMVAIPTTAGTGSEVSLWSVFTDDTRGVKSAAGSTLLYPSVALCDPELTLSLPPALTAATGMDALGHAIECYTNNACQPISGALAIRAIELIGRHLRTAVLNGSDRTARYAMMAASTMAGIAMNPTRLGLAHALAMPLGSFDLKIPHGLAIAITLPVVMEFNFPAHFDRFAEVARALGEKVDHLPAHEAAALSVEAVRRLSRDIGIFSGLGELGFKEEHTACVAAEAIKSGNVVVNPRQASEDDLRRILREAR
ncbi:MAG: iron-containing alcohol dehydrogenase [Rhodospirillales bacterium]